MAGVGRKNGYNEGGGYNSSYEKNGNTSDDGEAGMTAQSSASSKEKNDPFGDESSSEVKYRTMAWW